MTAYITDYRPETKSYIPREPAYPVEAALARDEDGNEYAQKLGALDRFNIDNKVLFGELRKRLSMARVVLIKNVVSNRAEIEAVIADVEAAIAVDFPMDGEIEAAKMDGFEYTEIGDPDDYVLATSVYEFEGQKYTSLDQAVAQTGGAAPTYRVLLKEDTDGKIVDRSHRIRVLNGKLDKVWTTYVQTIDLTKNESWKSQKYRRLSVSIPDTLHDAVEAYRTENGLQNFSQALVEVASKALNVEASLPKRGGSRPGAGKKKKDA